MKLIKITSTNIGLLILIEIFTYLYLPTYILTYNKDSKTSEKQAQNEI